MSSAQVLDFQGAVRLACRMVPGLAHDMQLLVERRRNVSKDMEGIGRWGLSIPDPCLKLLREYKPELFQDDQELQNREWLKFMQSDDAQFFKVRHTI